MRQIGKARHVRRWRNLVGAIIVCLTGIPSWAEQISQPTYSSPEDAAEALASAWHAGNTAALLAVFGQSAAALTRSGDPEGERIARRRLAAAYDEAHQIEDDGAGHAVIVLGKDDWPYPIPLTRENARWHFDIPAGAQQIIDRRIGYHEIHAIQVCRAYVEAQLSYGDAHRTPSGRQTFATRIASSPGKHDGLYWVTSGGDQESPLGPFLAAADVHGASGMPAQPFRGYLFRVLTSQGKHAPGGAQTYIVDGQMTGGFALLAFPAAYGVSGVMTFVVNRNGVVYQKNLGPHTADIVRRIRAYDPDDSWTPALP
jgi:hypothetical protein